MPSFNSWLTQVFDHPTLTGAVTIAWKTLLIYMFLILGLRLLGKRQLGQMTVYDLVLIIVLGNSVQNAMMNNDNSLGGGLIAATVLLVANKIFNLFIRRSTKLERLMVGQPLLILNHGVPIQSRMEREGVTLEELKMALREHGLTKLDQAKICVLEVDGSISVVANDAAVYRTKRHFKGLRTP